MHLKIDYFSHHHYLRYNNHLHSVIAAMQMWFTNVLAQNHRWKNLERCFNSVHGTLSHQKETGNLCLRDALPQEHLT